MRMFISWLHVTGAFRFRALLVLPFVAAVVFLVISPRLSLAQMRVTHRPEHLHTNQAAKIYLGYDGVEKFDGAYLALPIAWSLKDVILLSGRGQLQEVSYKQSSQFENRFYLFAKNGFSGNDQIVLEIDTGYRSSSGTIRLVPFKMNMRRFEPVPEMQQDLALQQHFQVDQQIFLNRNRVLAMDAGLPGLVLPARTFPDLSSRSSYTAELWLKTTSADVIVLSTWDGDENTSYPVELTIHDAGHLVFFRGVSGEHQTMHSQNPVADGTWHHVAVTQNSDTGWTRLFLDGMRSDSLYNASAQIIEAPAFLSVSGRPVRETNNRAGSMRLTGFVDEVRIWPEARDLELIRLGMRQSLGTRTDGVLILSFDEEDSNSQIARRTRHLDKVKSDLSFYEGVENINLVLDAGTVLLTWEATDPEVMGFTIERSVDGADFEDLSVVVVGFNHTGKSHSYWYRDIDAPDSVAYYRIRQRFSDGTERVTAAVKVGMGSHDESLPATLTGNYPNPFNPVTTITYTVKEREKVKITVWDLSGQLIAILFDGVRDVGEFEVTFEGSERISGTYFVRLETGGGVSSRQIVLMK